MLSSPTFRTLTSTCLRPSPNAHVRQTNHQQGRTINQISTNTSHAYRTFISCSRPLSVPARTVPGPTVPTAASLSAISSDPSNPPDTRNSGSRQSRL